MIFCIVPELCYHVGFISNAGAAGALLLEYVFTSNSLVSALAYLPTFKIFHPCPLSSLMLPLEYPLLVIPVLS